MIGFIASKFQPPRLSASLIKRARLIERFRGNLALNATFVCAGAGWGKTTLAAEFLNTIEGPVVWYDLEASDADIAVFFRYLVRAVRQAAPGFGHDTLALLGSGVGANFNQLSDLFLYELSEAVERDLIVVLDNVHHIFAAEWSAPVLYRILHLLPGGIHFILLARVAPGFTFSRMRSKQSMDQIGDRALAFTRSEARDLFQGVLDDPETIDGLVRLTQGWAAGLQIIRKALASESAPRELEVEQIITQLWLTGNRRRVK